MIRSFAWAALLSLCCGAALAQESAHTAYVGATLIDGTGRAAVGNATVLVENDRILAAGLDVEVPAGARVVDAQGKWIVPGLIDSHMHFMTSGRSYTSPTTFDLTDKVSYEEEIEWIRARVPDTLRAFMCSGVTSVLSMGGPSIEYSARETARGMDDAPTVFIAHGIIVHIPRSIAERTRSWDGELTMKPMRSEEDGAAIVEEAADLGADLIKTLVDDRGSSLVRMAMRRWRELEGSIIEEAAQRGMMVTTHIQALEYARDVMELGVASLQHIPADEPVDEAFIELARERGVIVTPTLGLRERTYETLITKEIDLLPIEESCSVPGIIESWDEPMPRSNRQMARFREQRETAVANAKALYDAGVTLAAATDSGMMGLAAGSSLHVELRALNRAGIPAEYLIQAATLNGAMVAGKQEDYGSVEAGKFADFLILAADPIEDIGNLQEIERVVKHGREFAQAELLPRDDA